VAALAAILVGRPLWVHIAVLVDLDRARRALAASDPQRALDWLTASEARQTDNAELQYLLGKAHRRNAHFHEAKRYFDGAQSLGWSKADLERQRMMMLFQMGDVQEAETYLTALLEAGVSDELAEEIYEVLVMGFLTEFRIRDADVCIDHWLDWKPRSISARVWRAHMLQSLRRDDEYVAMLREILSIDASRVTERLALAHWLLGNTQVDEALSELERCARQAPPGDAQVLFALGLCHYKQGTADLARRELDEALSKTLDARQRAEAYTTLGQIALAEADYELAVRHFEKALELTPESPVAPHGLGTALTRMGDVERGMKYLHRAQRLQELDDRLDELGRELLKDTANTALRIEAARLLLEMGDKTKAATYMLSALRYDPALKEAHEMLADYYDEQGRADLARRHRALAGGP
jgi:tetratricopeptide (TPR) repeat protein